MAIICSYELSSNYSYFLSITVAPVQWVVFFLAPKWQDGSFDRVAVRNLEFLTQIAADVGNALDEGEDRNISMFV